MFNKVRAGFRGFLRRRESRLTRACSRRARSTRAADAHDVRHSAEVINKRKSIWVEVIRRHTVPLEMDGLYGVKQLTAVFSIESEGERSNRTVSEDSHDYKNNL